MAYTVLQSFRDELTHIVYKPGVEYPADAPIDRIEKLTSLSVIAETVEVVTEANTVGEIKTFLDAKDIEYPTKATKADLLELLED
ncbi:HeH/LEM domain-containing protein [Leuconostoc sp. MS02]|uniref:HeH/LEM domain-containing protein n=1 Tax=Leuconostoc aquikimchii TaxID=3236804 RepID=A0ABV3S279_9LACO